MLIDLGFTKNESNIYLCLIQDKDLSVNEITSKTSIHRRNVYDTIARLIEKGIVNETLINNKKRFNAIHPKILLSHIDEQRKKISAIVPILSKEFNYVKKRNFVRLYSGIEGVKASFTESLEMLNKDDNYYAIGCIDMAAILGKGFMEEHHLEREKKKINSRVLFNYEYKKRVSILKNRKKYHARILPKNYYLPVQTVIYSLSNFNS